MHSKNLLVLQHATFFCSVILLSLSQTNNCFRLNSVSDVVYENETSTASTRTAPTNNNQTQAKKMIVANEIFNLPRFDPKGQSKVAASNFSQLPSPSSTSAQLLHADHEDAITLRNASSLLSQSNDLDECQYCPEARFLQHYFAKGCIAKHLQTECRSKSFCPKYFDCPPEKPLPKDACLYDGKEYTFGETVPHRDPCQHCVCINSTIHGPMLSCAISECFNSWTALEANCYRKYTEGQCCPQIVCLPETSGHNQTSSATGEEEEEGAPSLPTCEYEGSVHSFGDYFSPEGDPCTNCLCDERWNRTGNLTLTLEAVCSPVSCHFDFDRPENRGCVPVYGEKACCPMYFHCPDDSKAPKCIFGDNSYEVGEQVKVKQHEICLECSCLVPPEISCKHKACPMAPPVDESTNCTAQYIEGECCPQYKCTSVGLANGDFTNLDDKENDLSSSTKEEQLNGKITLTSTDGTDELHEDSNVQSQHCPPLNSCTEPCKVVEEDHHHHHSGNQNEDNDQSEGVRCPKCHCPQQEEAQSSGNHINSTSSRPCDVKGGSLCGRSASEHQSVEDEERQHWGKSVRVHRPSSRCPPVNCHHPCYIYRVASGDCPRCICSPKLPPTEEGFL